MPRTSAIYVDAAGDLEEASAAVLAAGAVAAVVAKKRGYCAPCFRWWKTHPRFVRFAVSARELLGAGFFVYDVFTDWELYLAVSAVGKCGGERGNMAHSTAVIYANTPYTDAAACTAEPQSFAKMGARSGRNSAGGLPARRRT